ncbi:MAG: Spx/MgsR family RNA polymerase-binding regulatory protein [Burkholderiales bacterium]
MTIRIYEYAGCSTCKKALKYLDAKKKNYEKVPIVEQPPTVSELKTMLGYLKASGKTFRNLFNTSGEQYRALKIGDRIKAGMTEQEAIALLAKNGKLIKRPFLLTDKGGATGFQAETWDTLV